MPQYLERLTSMGVGVVIGIALGRADIDARAIPIYIVAGGLIVWGRWALDKRRAAKVLRP